jgi:hypothetical protein
MWVTIIMDALSAKGVVASARRNTPLVGLIIGQGRGTGGSAVAEDKQCAECEKNQNLGGGREPYSITQRQDAVTRGLSWVMRAGTAHGSAGSTPQNVYVGQNYAAMTPGQQDELKLLKIEQVVSDIAAVIADAELPSPADRTNPDFIVYQDIKPNPKPFLDDVKNKAIAQSSTPAV